MSRLTYDITPKDRQDSVFKAIEEVNKIEAECGVSTGFSHTWLINALGYGHYEPFGTRPEIYYG